jgi:cytochrome c-type biogenesis protein
VAPLAVAGLLWERRREHATRLFTARVVQLRLGGWRRPVPLGTLLGGLLLIGMGILAWVLAFAGPGMSSDGWQSRVSAWLQHLATISGQALSWVPGWAVAVVLVTGFAVLLRRLRRERPTDAGHRGAHPTAPEPADAEQTR